MASESVDEQTSIRRMRKRKKEVLAVQFRGLEKRIRCIPVPYLTEQRPCASSNTSYVENNIEHIIISTAPETGKTTITANKWVGWQTLEFSVLVHMIIAAVTQKRTNTEGRESHNLQQNTSRESTKTEELTSVSACSKLRGLSGFNLSLRKLIAPVASCDMRKCWPERKKNVSIQENRKCKTRREERQPWKHEKKK